MTSDCLLESNDDSDSEMTSDGLLRVQDPFPVRVDVLALARVQAVVLLASLFVNPLERQNHFSAEQ